MANAQWYANDHVGGTSAYLPACLPACLHACLTASLLHACLSVCPQAHFFQKASYSTILVACVQLVLAHVNCFLPCKQGKRCTTELRRMGARSFGDSFLTGVGTLSDMVRDYTRGGGVYQVVTHVGAAPPPRRGHLYQSLTDQ